MDDLGTIMLSEISQSEKDKYYMISLECYVEWNSQNKLMNKLETETWTHEEADRCQRRGLSG